MESESIAMFYDWLIMLNCRWVPPVDPRRVLGEYSRGWRRRSGGGVNWIFSNSSILKCWNILLYIYCSVPPIPDNTWWYLDSEWYRYWFLPIPGPILILQSYTDTVLYQYTTFDPLVSYWYLSYLSYWFRYMYRYQYGSGIGIGIGMQILVEH